MREPMTLNHAEPMALSIVFGDEDKRDGYSMVEGSAVAVLPIKGVLVPEWSMQWTKEAAIAAKNDPACRAVVLEIDSPGGYVRGMDDMLAALRALAADKHVYAVSRQATSGAFWAATVAREIAATPNAMVGSIGVMGGVFYDTSKAAKASGVDVKVAATSPNKAMGAYGVPITDEMMAAEQKTADAMGEAFFADVAKSRRMTVAQVKSLNAETMTGGTAYALGLVDRVVASCDDYIAEIAARYPAVSAEPAPMPVPAQFSQSNTASDVAGTTAARAAGASTMSETNTTAAPAQEEITAAQPSTAPAPVAQPAPVAASAKELAENIPDPAFCFKAIEAGLTLPQALAAFIKHQAANTKPEPKGVAPVNTGVRNDAPASPAVAQFGAYLDRVRAGEDPVAAGRAMFTAEQLAPVDGVTRPTEAGAPKL